MPRLIIITRLATLAVSALIFSSSISFGQDIEGPRALGMGGAFTAIADDTSAVRLNPAGIAQKRTYALSLSSSKVKGGQSALNATIVDYQTTEMPVGVSYTRETITGLKRDYGIVSFAEKTGKVLIGISGKYFSQESTVKEQDYSYDAGVLVVASDKLSIGFAGKNLERTKFAFIHKKYSAGLAFKVTPLFRLSLDYTKDRDETGEDSLAAAGLEYALKKNEIIVRGGYTDDKIRNAEYYSAGLTLSSPSINFEYGYRWNKNDSSDNIQAFSIQMML